MKFFLNHPFLSGTLVFLLTAASGSALGFIAGILIIVNDSSQPLNSSDPHDGAAMASGMIFSLVVMASLITACFAGLITTIILQSKQKNIISK